MILGHPCRAELGFSDSTFRAIVCCGCELANALATSRSKGQMALGRAPLITIEHLHCSDDKGRRFRRIGKGRRFG